MKQFLFLLAAALSGLTARAQQELHIHHINIENGDATLIGIYDAHSQHYTAKILIDGGESAPKKMLLPYIAAMIGSDKTSSHFNYVILTHYHADHYKGLLALEDGQITADSIIDPGGYAVASYFKQSDSSGTKPDKLEPSDDWLDAMKAAASHTPGAFVKGRSRLMVRYDANAGTSIGHKLVIGKINNTNVELECIAGWGNTLSKKGQVTKNPAPKRSNANNFTLAFVLSCGEFRYFIGGDMGGSGSPYIDQESSVTEFFEDHYPSAVSITGDATAKGHVCGFKANHHGSDNSNTTAFMNGMRPAITVTSAGEKKQWHLPPPAYISRLSAVKPLTETAHPAEGVFNRGVYFTNLYNFSGFATLDSANTHFKNKPGISYSYGNDSPAGKNSYLIKLTNEATLAEKSEFEVGSVNLQAAPHYKKLALFYCHKK